LVPNKDVDRWVTFDPNDHDIQFTGKKYQWQRTADFKEDNQPIPYWTSKKSLNPATVRGQLNGTTYPFIFDTGNNSGLMIEDSQINRHRLPVYFFDATAKESSGGLAIVETLETGPLTFKNIPCNFLKHHAEHRLFGILPVHRYEWVVFPLSVIRSFRYVEFNQLTHALTLSPEESFEPVNAADWIALPFEISEEQILLKIPVETIDATLFLDTGAYFGLNLRGPVFETLAEQRPDFKRVRKKRVVNYFPYAGGEIKAKIFTVKNFHLADYCLDHIELNHSEDTAPLSQRPGGEADGIIGMGLFKNTVMVLDFETNQMWVKKAEGSYFEECS
jgi:hypothetical protein